MTTNNPFVLDANQYKRDIDFPKHYTRDVVEYLHISTGKTREQCRAFVAKKMKEGGSFAIQDPKVEYLRRKENGDREQRQTTLLQYYEETIQNNELLAPTFTTYTDPKVNQSILVDFIDENITKRSQAKKAMFRAKMARDDLLYTLKKLEQGNRKTSNNSMSGGHVSSSTPLHNRTAHSTLTSNCRSTSGNGNANNEKLLSGNRHYWNSKITLNNIVSVVNHTDYEKIKNTMDKWDLRHPSVQETMDCITYSTNLYWRNADGMSVIERFVNKLTPIQRSAFVYTGDLYHLAKYNGDFMHRFIAQLSMAVHEPCPDADAVFESHREEYTTLAKQFFPNEMKGKTLDDTKGTELYGFLASTVKNIHHTVMQYASFIDAFLVTENVPASVAFFPESIRRAALTSDTDSTIFTVQDWVFWQHGDDPGFTPQTQSTAATMIFLAAETITHVLARMSANFGIMTERIHKVAMKNEFKFDVFVPTQVGKHYFAYISSQEGNIFKDFEIEIKGVHLKSSNVPKEIVDDAEKMMRSIMDTVIQGKKLSLHHYLTWVADKEREIKRSVAVGESKYFRGMMINTPDSYTKDEDGSPYQYYKFWEEIFAPSYGAAPPPPYYAVRVPVQLPSKTIMKEWIDGIADKGLSQRLSYWMERTGKTSATTMVLPEQALALRGMPVEISSIMDIRKIVFSITGIYYLVLETLGYYCVDDKITNLVSDLY